MYTIRNFGILALCMNHACEKNIQGFLYMDHSVRSARINSAKKLPLTGLEPLILGIYLGGC